jgi:flagellar motor protein MotB
LALVGSAFCYADTAGIGTTTSNFLKIQVPASAAGMGQAYSAIGDDEGATSFNPAGIANAIQSELSASDIAWFQDISIAHVGGVFPTSHFALSGYLTWLGVTSLDLTQRGSASSANPLGYTQAGTFAPYDLAFGFGMARPWLKPNLNFGLQLDGVMESLSTDSGFGLGLDAGVQYTDLVPNLDAGLNVQHLGIPLQMGSFALSQPTAFNGGLVYGLLDRQLNLALEVSQPLDQGFQFSLGGEGWLYDLLALRAGYVLGSVSQWTAGMGVRWRYLKLDYAYVPYTDLGGTQRVTVSYLWGGPASGAKISETGGRGPEADKDKDRFLIQPKIPGENKLRYWKVEVADAEGKVVKTFVGKGTSLQTVAWDGKDDKGLPVQPGAYEVRAKGLYRKGIVSQPTPESLVVLAPTPTAAPVLTAVPSPVPRFIHFTLAADTQFETGKANLKSSSYFEIDKVVAEIKKYRQAGTWVEVIGYTDDRPIRSPQFKDNQELSEARAQAVVQALKNRLGDVNWLRASGKGDMQPVASNATAEGRAKNRRVEILVLAAKARGASP